MVVAHRILIEVCFTRSPRFIPSEENLMREPYLMRADLWEWNYHIN